MSGGDALEAAAKVEPEEEGATMMGRRARELMLSGQGDAALQAFKVQPLIPACTSCDNTLYHHGANDLCFFSEGKPASLHAVCPTTVQCSMLPHKLIPVRMQSVVAALRQGHCRN